MCGDGGMHLCALTGNANLDDSLTTMVRIELCVVGYYYLFIQKYLPNAYHESGFIQGGSIYQLKCFLSITGNQSF